MLNKKQKVIVVGAGAAGLTASIFASMNKSNEVILLERGQMAGKKILMSGGTRCNVLPASFNYEDYFTDSSKNMMKNIFKSWSLEKCHEWIEKDIGLKMKLEKESNKYFPVSNSSMEVRDLLLKKALDLGVKVIYNFCLEDLYFKNNSWFCVSSEGKEFQSDKVIISTGGLSIPQMGTDGKGHKILKNLGHKINKTYPALTPLKGIHPANSMIAGISLDVQLTLKAKDKKNKKAEREGFLFTHKGFSGPSILDLSHYVIQAMETSDTKPVLTVNWNGFSEEKWRELLQPSKINLLNRLKEYMPIRLAEALCSEAKLEGRNLTDLKKEERNKLISLLTQYNLNYTGHEGYEKAEVTGGGIPLEEINTATMESKLHEGLFVCGELLDVFGRIGGFNFYWAWLTGRLAGLNVSN